MAFISLSVFQEGLAEFLVSTAYIFPSLPRSEALQAILLPGPCRNSPGLQNCQEAYLAVEKSLHTLPRDRGGNLTFTAYPLACYAFIPSSVFKGSSFMIR